MSLPVRAAAPGHGQDPRLNQPALTLPIVCLITDRTLAPDGRLIDAVVEAVAGGVTMVQLREKDLPTRALLELARAIRSVMDPAAVLLINGRADVAFAVGASGVHLPTDGLAPDAVRNILGPSAIIGRAAHTAPEVQMLATHSQDETQSAGPRLQSTSDGLDLEGIPYSPLTTAPAMKATPAGITSPSPGERVRVRGLDHTQQFSLAGTSRLSRLDYVELGTIFPSRSHPGGSIVGATEIAAASQYGIPILAVGGITRDNAASVISAGARGIAVISAILADPAPREAALRLSDAVQEAWMKRLQNEVTN